MLVHGMEGVRKGAKSSNVFYVLPDLFLQFRARLLLIGWATAFVGCFLLSPS